MDLIFDYADWEMDKDKLVVPEDTVSAMKVLFSCYTEAFLILLWRN